MRPFLLIKSSPSSLKLNRLNGLSDGVTAIVLTLLVLGIEVPTDHNFSEAGLTSFLFKIEYEISAYVRLAQVVFLGMPLLHLSHQSVDAHLSEVIDRDEEGNLVEN